MKDWDKELEKEIEAYKGWKDKFGGFSRDMTLRDYFAAKAMQAIMGSDRYMGVIGLNNYTHNVSRDAYIMADAMLEARK